jgi:uncharacterized protein with HEPN domain
MRRETAKLLHDVNDACREIGRFSAGETQETVIDNRSLQLALQKLVENVGSALIRLSRLDPETARRIPDLRRCIDLSYPASYEYDSVDYVIVWETVHRHIPELGPTVTTLLTEAPPLLESSEQE